MRELFEKLGLDPEQVTPGRKVVRHIGESLVKAMEMALTAGEPKAAELVACECVSLAETKDHDNWELLAQCAEKAKGKEAQAGRKRYLPYAGRNWTEFFPRQVQNTKSRTSVSLRRRGVTK